jgi:hypothetical protein
MTQLTTTLNRINARDVFSYEYSVLLKCLGKTAPDDEIIPFSDILAFCGLRDAISLLRVEIEDHDFYIKLAVELALTYSGRLPERSSLRTLRAVIAYAHGEANEEQMKIVKYLPERVANTVMGDIALLSYDLYGKEEMESAVEKMERVFLRIVGGDDARER